MPKLFIKKNDQVIKKLSVPDGVLAFTVGSEQGNDIIIEDEKISYFHLQFEKQGNEYFVRDLQSQLGTYVNGTKINGRTLIKNNDEIGVGHHTITFQNPKETPTPYLILEDYEYEQLQSNSNRRIEDKIASVPALTKLNSWLHEEHDSFERKGDFFIESDEKNENDSFLDFKENNEASAKDSERNFTENNELDDNDSVQDLIYDNENSEKEFAINIETETLLQTEQIPTPKLDAKDDRLTYKEQPLNETTTHYLLGIYGPYVGKKFKLKHPETRIGRDRKFNDIVIRKNSKGDLDQSVSRRHATIVFENNKFNVIDKRSKSRTYVNQKKLDVNDKVCIVPGDEIEILSDKKSHIFRLVREGDWNFSFPKKAGNWHIRYRMAILNLYSIIFFLIAALFFTNSFKTKYLISKKPNPLKVKEAIWLSDKTDTELSSPKDSYFSTFPAIADLNGDKIIDLVYIDGKGNLITINGKTKKPLWTNYEFQALSQIPVTLEDLNNNSLPDVIVVSNDSRIRAIDGNWGIEIGKSPILAGPLTGPPVVGDFNGDGLKDLAIATLENVVYIGFLRLKNSRWIKLDFEEPIRSIASADDLTGNGIPNILIGTETGKIIIIDGIHQKILGEVNVNEELNKASGTFEQDNQVRFPTAFGDLNGDNTTDIIISTMQGNLIAFSGTTLERIWYDQTSTKSYSTQSMNQSISLGDLDGDRLLDVISLTPEGKIRALKGKGVGKDRKMVLWEYPISEVGNFVGTPTLADFNKNSTMDVVAVDKNGNFYIFEGSTGEILWKNTKASLAVLSSPLIGDLDNDNYLDILVLKSDRRFYKLLTNSLTLGNTVVWGQMFGNSRHTNISSHRYQNASVYYLYMGISIVVILGLIGLNVLIRKKRKELSYSHNMM
ncbi:MAG: FHA domain-containing protein [bacterium]